MLNSVVVRIVVVIVDIVVDCVVSIVAETVSILLSTFELMVDGAVVITEIIGCSVNIIVDVAAVDEIGVKFCAIELDVCA